jgi:anti-sigma factor RsiW
VNCQETQELIHAYIDGELDLMKSLEMDQHLQGCSACSQVHQNLQAVRTAIRESSCYLLPPSDLQKRVQRLVRGVDQANSVRRSLRRRWLAVAASLVFVASAAWALSYVVPIRAPDGFLTQELVASHVRSQVLPGHRVDVESSDQHTVKPWFEERLDFAPSVPDLKDQGFDLVGGRLDYMDNRLVAALVYQRRKHFINLFIWPTTPGKDAAAQTVTRQDVHLVHWTKSAMSYWAISYLNERELQEFGRLIQERTP